MSSIHFFQRYSQKENLVTNNSLLFLSKLHSYNRLKFEKFFSLLCAEEDAAVPDISLHFKQQIGTERSILDGYIYQEGFKIAIETKLGPNFRIEQLRNHLSHFKQGQPQQYLLLLSTNGPALSQEEIRSLQRDESGGPQILQTSFEKVISHFRRCLSEHDEEMLALAADFEAFCSEEKLLDTDSHTIFAPPCGRSFRENIRYKLYYCPSTWSRRHSAYLGIYHQKGIRALGKISKVVICDINLEKNTVEAVDAKRKRPSSAILTSEEIARIIAVAREAKENNGWDLTTETQFFLCDEMVACDFRKESDGGIMGHRYLDLKNYLASIPDNLEEIARGLSERKWQ
ncbi:hypothetical protein HBDW_05050 [Herbaspirillum sp. DW155]|uniref:hypothetical protein n=1 Tax=Herbaspirillum sp. DW155 TaxID=3095609 RepID=UPI0030923362|nr:hypothetical protein HBDW_05050 [Herbaspirillum sp. DW155]